MSNICNHGRVVCSCGLVMAQCRCIESYKNTTVSGNPCTHQNIPESERRYLDEKYWVRNFEKTRKNALQPIDLWPEDLTTCRKCRLDMVRFKHSVDQFNEVVCPPDPNQ